MEVVVAAGVEVVWAARALTLPRTGRRTLKYRISAPRVAGRNTGHGQPTTLRRLQRSIRLTPDGEESLEDKVHGDPVKDGAQEERLEEAEGAKDDLSSLAHARAWLASACP